MHVRPSPLQNRVAPDGTLHAIAARGTLMGNRGGRLHDRASGRLGSARWTSRRWIACLLCFNDRQRSVMGAGYTELFFLDEATALTAGHRPCFECRRAHAKAFQAAWQEAGGLERPPGADAMDRELHAERAVSATAALPVTALDDILRTYPDGTFFRANGGFFAKRNGGLVSWGFDGYRPAPDLDAAMPVEVLTPAAVIAVLSAGYPLGWHQSTA
jgi:hypothetical protein